MAHHDDDYWGEEIPADQVVNPIVYQFRPNKIVAVDAEHRAEFEEYFRQNVGFPPRASGGSRAVKWPHGGVSGSNDGWDDCIE